MVKVQAHPIHRVAQWVSPSRIKGKEQFQFRPVDVFIEGLVGECLIKFKPVELAKLILIDRDNVHIVNVQILSSGLIPRRTMRFVLFGGEEEGLIGSQNYAREDQGELVKCAWVFMTDSGSEAPRGWLTFGLKDDDLALVRVLPVLASIGAGATADDSRMTFYTDEAPFLLRWGPSFVHSGRLRGCLR